jgi:cyanophycinase
VAPVFLIGGGRGSDGIRASHEGFVRAAGGGPIVAVVLDEGADTDPDRWSGALALAGAREVRELVVSAARPPRAEDVADAAGVFVAGGWVPGYHEALVAAGSGWLPRGVPYAGFSAGAALAAGRAILGGWRLDGVAVCAPEAGEDLEEVAIAPGLGLRPFAVDVHATQWGTLTRLVHAVAAGLVDEGWAVDEDTALVLDDAGPPRVAGLGAAYRVARDGERLSVTVARPSPGPVPPA